MIGIAVGWAYANFGEWLVHKHILHRLGKHRDSYWSFHWHDHHRNARRHAMYDPHYALPFWRSAPRAKEVAALIGTAVAHLPLLPVAPFFTATLGYRIVRYYQLHKRAHLDPEWAEEHLPWHVDHHLGADQNANWCVTHPLFDELVGTRVPREKVREQVPASEPLRAVSTSRGR